METVKIPATVYAEATPNPLAMKFVANKILNYGSPAEFLSIAETYSSPLATLLFQYPFVKGIFISGDYVTITKSGIAEWQDVTGQLREVIQDYLRSGQEIFTHNGVDESSNFQVPSPKPQVSISKSQPEIGEKIMQVLEEYVRPAVERDGGAISFKSFKDGVVTVTLRGSCSGCPSATYTLKAGIEGVLKQMVPEVNEVVAEQM